MQELRKNFYMSLLDKKKDKLGQELHPGDICVYNGKFVVYKRPSWGGDGSKGLFGQFITDKGASSVKYSSVLFVFDPLGKRRNDSPEVKTLTRRFYE